jgi:hypothetical protein
MMIGHRLTSPAVAARLNLSVCTVEGHIDRAMTKTGVAGRHDLATSRPGKVDNPRQLIARWRARVAKF